VRKSKFREHQITAILKAVEAGQTVKDVCREHEISYAAYYQWMSQYGGMQASDIKRLRELEEENRRLKQISADLLLENCALKDVSTKKLLSQMQSAAGGCFYKHRHMRLGRNQNFVLQL
jgi:putative transposase